MKQRVGLIINPVAGMGGSVGLKGSDGAEVFKRALELGAKPRSGARAALALNELVPLKENIVILTGPGDMGETLAQSMGFETVVLPVGSGAFGNTTPDDTIALASQMKAQGVKVIIFAGGDGTARNIFTAVGDDQMVIGIPAGVKIHSAVYAINPRSAGALAADVLLEKSSGCELGEVMDIDEEQFRQGIITARLFGYMQIPYTRKHLQGGKVSSRGEDRGAVGGIARIVCQDMLEDTLYIVGSGSTTAAIMAELGVKNTLLGVDAVVNKKVIGNDLNENQLLELLKEYPNRRIIVTPIGGQACLFGRGNQQISPAVIKEVGRENIIVVATKSKIDSFYGKQMLVDSGDDQVNEMLRGYIRVVVSYGQESVVKIG